MVAFVRNAASSSRVEAVLALHDAAIRRFFRATAPSAHEAEDLYQQLVLKVVLRVDFDTVSSARAFLLKMAQNILIDHRRQAGRGIFVAVDREERDETQLQLTEASPEEHLIWRQSLELGQKAIDDLPELCRRAFILHKVEGLDYQAIACELGISVMAARKHVSRALIQCRKFLQAHGTDGISARRKR